MSQLEPVEGEVERFWHEARRHAGLETMPGYFGPDAISSVPPPTWAFGDDADADALLALVLDGTKTAMTSAREDYVGEEQLPERGAMSILLDAAGHPRALVATTSVTVVVFDEVDEEHARAEGEGDGTLDSWRASQQRHLTEHDPLGRGFRPDMPVVLEHFELLHPAPHSRATFRAMFGR